MTELEGLVAEQLHLLKPVEDLWQPGDHLPDLTREDWRESLGSMRDVAARLSDAALVVLVGNIVTEEALPSYQTWLNRFDLNPDETGASLRPWAQWTRGWTAEEKRHGDVLSKYLYLTGRVNMRSVETTTHHLIRNGFNPETGQHAYRAMVYVSFQERATKISHANMGRLAERQGETTLSRICTAIAADEARHEEAYKRLFRRIVEIEPAEAVIAFAQMMKRGIAMPARLMSDGTSPELFDRFAVVAQKAGVYTFKEYAEILAHLVEFWGIAALKGLSGEAAKAQDYLSALPGRYLSKADVIMEAMTDKPAEPFEWLYGRSV